MPQTAVVPSSIAGKPGAMGAKVMLLAMLAERLLPYVDAVLRPRAKTGVASLMRLITERAPEIREMLGTIEDGTASLARIRAFGACGIGLKPMTLANLKKKVAWTIEDSVESATFTLALGWLDCFPRGKSGTAIDTDKLDEAMLPRLNVERAMRFANCCRQAGMSEEEAREVLAKVKAKLPAGEHIPDEAAQLLDASLITIVR